jgi:streptomycin 6-kinase
MGDRPELEALAAIARDVAAEWGVPLEAPFTLARYSFVAPAGADAVLKVTPPEDDESDEEADALALWDGKGAVPLLRHDRDRRALLVRRARPGTDLSALDEAEATAAAVEVALQLWRPAGAPFRWIGDHVPRWLAATDRRGNRLGALARELYAELDVGSSTLVHGDFHHHNVLSSGNAYLAIDPKPMLGEPEYDVATFLWNPLEYRMRADVTERRLAAFAAAGLDEWRMRAWAVIRGAYLGADEATAGVLEALLRAA